MAKVRQTTDKKQAWTLGGLVLGTSLFFGYVILPQLDATKSALVGEAAPDFTLPVIYKGEPGSKVRLADQRGKAVVLDFWASWCAPCRAQAGIVDDFVKKADASRVYVLGVNTSDEQGAAVRYAKSEALSYPSVFDSAGVAQGYKVYGLPTLIVIDRTGKVTAVRTRVVREKELAELVAQAAGS